MSDPLTERLSRLTPDAGTLNRDALLFAAGRASARASQWWRATAGALAASQILTLVLLWPTSPQLPGAVPIVEQKATPTPDRAGWPAPQTVALSVDDEWKRPTDTGPFVPDEPVLHVFSNPPADLVN